jgi:hypothetical protein
LLAQENNIAAYQHRVSGFFVKREEAEIARSALLRRGLTAQQLELYANDHADLKPPASTDSNDSLKQILVDSAIGGAVGTTVGALGEVALVAASATLFVASPLIAPLAMLGWGAGLGAAVGAAAGSIRISKEGGMLSALVADAIQSGQVVLIATTHTESQTQAAIEIVQAAVGTYQDTPQA